MATDVDVDYDSNADRVLATIVAATFDGLVDAAEFLLTESRAEVPIDEATLERSGAVSQDRSIDTVAVSYDTVYAVRQHEELTWRHAPGRKAKYLEDPVNELRDEMLAIIATKVRREMRGG